MNILKFKIRHYCVLDMDKEGLNWTAKKGGNNLKSSLLVH